MLKKNRLIAYTLLTISIIIFTPFDDILWFPIALALNLPEIIIVYFSIGIIFLILSLHLLGVTKVFRKLSKQKMAIVISALIFASCVIWLIYK